MRQAGADGPLDQLRARAYLHLLCGQPACTLTGSDAPAGPPLPGPVPCTASRSDPGPGQPAPRGTIHLTMPLASWLGWSESPGEAAGYGPLDADDARALAAPGSPLTPRPPGALRSPTQAGGRPPTVAPGSYQALRKPGPPAASRRRRSPGSGRLATPDHYHAAADQRLHSSPGRQRLPARTQAAPPHPGPQRVLYRARVPSAGRSAAIWTTPSRTTWAAGPASATWGRSAAAITAASKPRAGISASRGPASCAGPRPQDAPTRPHPPFTAVSVRAAVGSRNAGVLVRRAAARRHRAALRPADPGRRTCCGPGPCRGGRRWTRRPGGWPCRSRTTRWTAGDFEGVHEGQRRGTGAVIIWDEGPADIVRDEPGHLCRHAARPASCPAASR